MLLEAPQAPRSLCLADCACPLRIRTQPPHPTFEFSWTITRQPLICGRGSRWSAIGLACGLRLPRRNQKGFALGLRYLPLSPTAARQVSLSSGTIY